MYIVVNIYRLKHYFRFKVKTVLEFIISWHCDF